MALKPGGYMLISTPIARGGEPDCAFHKYEYGMDELTEILGRYVHVDRSEAFHNSEGMVMICQK